jgi:hypothetical protein
MSERVSLINSYKTQLNNDFDFSASLLHLFGEKGGVIYTNSQQKSEFKLQD